MYHTQYTHNIAFLPTLITRPSESYGMVTNACSLVHLTSVLSKEAPYPPGQ